MVLSTQDYVGGIEYKNEVLEAVYHAEGRVYFEDGTNRYEYTITDHLGNARLTFTDKDGDGRIDQSDDPEVNEVLQENHYYPFGMAMDGQWIGDPGRESKYRYNGKELNEEFGLNWYAYGARYYDPAIGRFTGMDPIADDFPNLSEYNYASNKPVNGIDLHGLQWAPPLRPDGKVDIKAIQNRANWIRENPLEAAAPLTLVIPGPEDLLIFGLISRGGKFFKVGSKANDIIIGGKKAFGDIADDGFRVGAEGVKAGIRSIDDTPITSSGIETVTKHLSRDEFLVNGEMAANNRVMIDRLKKIASGKLKATDTDRYFYTHELRESELMNSGMVYDQAHAISAKEFGVTVNMEKQNGGFFFYTGEAAQALFKQLRDQK